MSIAILGSKFHNNNDKILTLDTGTLQYIDAITRSYETVDELKDSPSYRDKIRSYSNLHGNVEGEVMLSYIRTNEDKIELKLLFNDDDAIRTRTSSLEEVKSETERARKLLLNSKNQIFLTSFLLNKNLMETTTSTVKMTIDEYKIAKREGYNVMTGDGEYRIAIADVLRYRLNHKKLGPMRLLVEDTLEVWKKNMLRLGDEDLYFYSRELRLLINEYNYRKLPRKVVCNFAFNRTNLNNNMVLRKSNNFRSGNTIEFPKRKILEDRKAA